MPAPTSSAAGLNSASVLWNRNSAARARSSGDPTPGRFNIHNTPADYTAHVTAWYAHIRSLAVDIGPRGPTTEGERRGAQYCRESLEKLGLDVSWETFRSARSIFLPHLLASIAMLAAFAIYPLAGTWSAGLACLISFTALISDLLELSFQDNLLRRIVPKGESQNVVAVQPPAG